MPIAKVRQKDQFLAFVEAHYGKLQRDARYYVEKRRRSSHVLRHIDEIEVESIASDVLHNSILKVTKRLTPPEKPKRYKPFKGSDYGGYLHIAIRSCVASEFRVLEQERFNSNQSQGAAYNLEMKGEVIPDSFDIQPGELNNYLVQAVFAYAEKNFDYMTYGLFKKKMLDGWSDNDIAVAAGISKSGVHRRIKRVIDGVRLNFDPDAIRESIEQFKLKNNDCDCPPPF